MSLLEIYSLYGIDKNLGLASILIAIGPIFILFGLFGHSDLVRGDK